MAYYKLNRKVSESFWDASQKEEFDTHISNAQVGNFGDTNAIEKAKRSGRIIEIDEKEYKAGKAKMDADNKKPANDDKTFLSSVKDQAKKIIDDTNDQAAKILEDARNQADSIVSKAGNAGK